MATTISLATFQAACAACADAILANDLLTARTQLAVAEAIAAGLPVDSSQDGFRTKMREALTGLRTSITDLSTATQRATGTRLIGTRVGRPS